MNPVHRGGWPPQQQPGGSAHGNAEQSQPQGPPRPAGNYGQTQQSPSQGHSGLPPPPPPSGPYSHYHQQPHPPLQSLAGLSQSPPRAPPSGRTDGSQQQQQAPQGPGVPLPGFSQATGQLGAADRERERAREAEQIHIKEEEDRKYREQQERQRLEQAPPHQHQPGPPVHLHQPVAVGPRSVHGPNGLLGNASIAVPHTQSQIPVIASSGPAGIFAGGPVQPATQAHGPGGAQQMQPGSLLPFAGIGVQQQQQQQQQPQSQTQQMVQGQGQGQQPILNDALSYLDQVKVQFADHPDVYNRFLDIMKDFKSGAIDTPGVIGRVSTLFAGNPELIQGFNTFLPPGYRIECGTVDDPNAIRVTTPMGTTVQAMPQPRPLSRQEGGEGLRAAANGSFTPLPSQQSAKMMLSPNGRPLGPAAPGQQLPQHFSPLDAQRQQEQQNVHQHEQRNINSLPNAVSGAAPGPPGGLRPANSPRGTPVLALPDGMRMTEGLARIERLRGPVEFNHAISYVNKIKNRFSSQPDTYKQFLEILQTYQRESKPIQDVYAQVTHLFKTAPDLLEDFKQFLPESAAQAKAAERARQVAEESIMLSNVRGESGPNYTSPILAREQQQQQQQQHLGTPGHSRGNLPPVGNFAPSTATKDNKRKRGERQGTVGSVADNVAGPSAAKNVAYGAASNKRLKQGHTLAKASTDPAPPSPTLIPALPTPMPPTTTSAATHDELQFFDRVKKAIGNKNTMNEFLKLCNLFSQDYIDRATLMYRARAFIGNNPELMKWFQDFVGYDGKDVVIENKARVPTGRISLSNCRGLGPSYRLLPKRERVKPCSGRDELCNSVLNDEWASHPTWASEDSGFIAHRKNTYEEALHRIEEERHDYDYHIEACARTIQLMEPIAQSLRRMSDKEQMEYKLPPGLGGQSETIYKRVIMKLYGREKGHDVIEQLHRHPYQVVPVLLNRFKERLESWKMAQREWEKLWRDQTQKMFWRSLDHQAVSTKITDRRQFQMKNLQADVQVRYEEQKRQALQDPYKHPRGQPQLTSKVEDADVMTDTTYLILVHLEASRDTDAPRLAPFIREFVPLFFGIDPETFGAKLRQRFGETPPNGEVADDAMSGVEEAPAYSARTKSVSKGGNSMYRNVLDPGTKGRQGRDGSRASDSRASTPDVVSTTVDDSDAMAVDPIAAAAAAAANTTTSATDEAEVKADMSSDRWFSHPAMETEGPKHLDPNEPHERHTYRLWANTPIYGFMRMLVMLYERILRLKHAETDCREVVRKAKTLKPANDLGIEDKPPQEFFPNTAPDANYYVQMLDKFTNLLNGEADWLETEDCLRRFYLHAGYPLYNFEKMMQALVRYGATIVNPENNKERSWDILQLWKKDRARQMVSAVQSTDYRKGFEKLVRDGEGYAIDWDDHEKLVKIYLAKKDDPDFSPEGIAQQDRETRWRYYIASYSSVDETDGVPYKDLSPVMLFRNVRAIGADPKSDRYPPAPLANAGSGSTTTTTADGRDTPTRGTDGHEANGGGGGGGIGAESTSVGERVLSRILGAKNDERLVLRIAVNKYHILFQPGTAESLIQDVSWRIGGEEGVRQAEKCRALREESLTQMFEVTNEAMKGLGKDEIELQSEMFSKLS